MAYAFLLPWLPVVSSETLYHCGGTHPALVHKSDELVAHASVHSLETRIENTRLITLRQDIQIAFISLYRLWVVLVHIV